MIPDGKKCLRAFTFVTVETEENHTTHRLHGCVVRLKFPHVHHLLVVVSVTGEDSVEVGQLPGPHGVFGKPLHPPTTQELLLPGLMSQRTDGSSGDRWSGRRTKGGVLAKNNPIDRSNENTHTPPATKQHCDHFTKPRPRKPTSFIVPHSAVNRSTSDVRTSLAL